MSLLRADFLFNSGPKPYVSQIMGSMDFHLHHSLDILQRTPDVLRTLLSGLSDDWTTPNEGAETWSAYDVVGHLIDGEETDWMVRARILLSDAEERRFEPFDRFRHQQDGERPSLAERLDRFAELRAQNLRGLRALELGPEELARTGEHPELGTVTLAQLLACWTVHDLGHIAQISRVMAKQYTDAVGPWTAYLGVLRR